MKKFFLKIFIVSIFLIAFSACNARANDDFSQLDYSELIPKTTTPTDTTPLETAFVLPNDRFLNSYTIKCKVVCIGDNETCQNFQSTSIWWYLNDENEPDLLGNIYADSNTETFILDEIKTYTFPVNKLILAGNNGINTENIGRNNPPTEPPITCQSLGNSSGDQYVLFDWYEEPVEMTTDFPFQNDIQMVSGLIEFYASTTGTTTPYGFAKMYFQIPFLLYVLFGFVMTAAFIFPIALISINKKNRWN